MHRIKSRFALCALGLGLCTALSAGLPVRADESPAVAPPMVDIRPDVDIAIPRIRIQPPVAEPKLELYETLPSRMYYTGSVEASYRLETNPYQAPHGTYTDAFIRDSGVFRLQGDSTVGYALTPRDRIAVNYFALSNRYDNFTPFRLDSTSQSLGMTVDHVFHQGNQWTLTGAVTGREIFQSGGHESGDVLPSFTLVRRLGYYGYTYANAALDFNRSQFFIGDTDILTPIATLGMGYQFPWEATTTWGKLLRGVSANLSSTYSFATNYESLPGSPRNYQSLILTGELSRALSRHCPVSVFVRAEPVFNFGQDNDAFGLSGMNFRLFGGTRIAVAKPAIFTVDLNPPAQKGASAQ